MKYTIILTGTVEADNPAEALHKLAYNPVASPGFTPAYRKGEQVLAHSLTEEQYDAWAQGQIDRAIKEAIDRGASVNSEVSMTIGAGYALPVKIF